MHGDDAHNLLASCGAGDFEYREIVREEEQLAALQRWPLLKVVGRMLVTAERNRIYRTGPTGPTGEKTVAAIMQSAAHAVADIA